MSKVTGGLAVENKLQQLYAQGDEEEEEERRETEDVEAEEEVFTPEERSEFLNRILMHLALGGSLNQYDEHIAAYKKAAIAIYKALVRYDWLSRPCLQRASSNSTSRLFFFD